MFKKIGDAQPISVINPVDVDDKSTEKTLQETLAQVKAEEKQALKKEDKNV